MRFYIMEEGVELVDHEGYIYDKISPNELHKVTKNHYIRKTNKFIEIPDNLLPAQVSYTPIFNDDGSIHDVINVTTTLQENKEVRQEELSQ